MATIDLFRPLNTGAANRASIAALNVPRVKHPTDLSEVSPGRILIAETKHGFMAIHHRAAYAVAYTLWRDFHDHLEGFFQVPADNIVKNQPALSGFVMEAVPATTVE